MQEYNQPPGPSRRALGLFLASTFLYWASMYVYVPILPLYAQQLGASLPMVGIIVGAYGVTQFLVRAPLGIWSDRLGKRKPFVVAGLVIAGIGSAGLAVSNDPWLLFFSRALTGVSASAWVAFSVLFASYFPPARAVRAMSLVTFVNGIAQMLSTYSGGLLAEHFGWQAPFWVGAALGFAGGVCALGIFEVERPVASQLTRRKVLETMTVPLLLAVSFIAILSQFTVFTTTYTFTPIFARQLGASQADQGALTTAMLLAYTVAMLITARSVDYLGDRTIVMAGMALAAVACLATPSSADLQSLAGLQALQGLGRGLAFPVLMGLSIRAVPQDLRATAMGVFQAVYAIGMFAGPMFGGRIAELVGLDGVFYTTAVVCLLAVGLALYAIPGGVYAKSSNGKQH